MVFKYCEMEWHTVKSLRENLAEIWCFLRFLFQWSFWHCEFSALVQSLFNLQCVITECFLSKTSCAYILNGNCNYYQLFCGVETLQHRRHTRHTSIVNLNYWRSTIIILLLCKCVLILCKYINGKHTVLLLVTILLLYSFTKAAMQLASSKVTVVSIADLNMM